MLMYCDLLTKNGFCEFVTRVNTRHFTVILCTILSNQKPSCTIFSGFLTLCPGAISRRRQVSEGIVVRTSRPSNEEYQENILAGTPEQGSPWAPLDFQIHEIEPT